MSNAELLRHVQLQQQPRPRLAAAASAVLTLVAALGGCASRGTSTMPEPPTLKTLAQRTLQLPADPGIDTSEHKAIAAYRQFLEANPRAHQRSLALRRLGDLEMDAADRKLESGSGAADYRAAITHYQALLKAHPNDPANDRVLYQLARAHEQGGALEAALTTLDVLVERHPQTQHRAEAQFRRGELLFSTRAYPQAEAAFGAVLADAAASSFHERALYMQGWSRFKQARLPAALDSFLAVLDLRLGDKGEEPLESLPGLSRTDREIIEDTLRVTSLSLQQMEGATSIGSVVSSAQRQRYAFRLYQHLGELYLTQERIKDAAETFAAFARAHPTHAQAPRLQARVIDIYAHNGFAQLALEAKRDYVRSYGPASPLVRDNPQIWAQAAPLVRQHLEDLARHHHARFQQQRQQPDADEAERWYREWLQAFGQHPQAAGQRFLLAELLFEARRFDAAAAAYEQAAYETPTHARSADAGYAALLAQAEQLKSLGEAQAAQRPALQRALLASGVRFADAFAADTRIGPVLADAAGRAAALNEPRLANRLAQRVLTLQPATAVPHRRTALAILGQGALDDKQFGQAEQVYAQWLALPAEGAEAPPAARRAEIEERLAAAIYQQGEQARAAGKLADAQAHFARAASAAPNSQTAITARFDQAAAQLGQKDWAAGAQTLEALRREHPSHPLAAQATSRLAAAYLELNRPSEAAREFERLASSTDKPELARSALWQAAELKTQAGQNAEALRLLERYVREHPNPPEPAAEARWRLAEAAQQSGQAARAVAWARELRDGVEEAGSARTPRQAVLQAKATLLLAEPAWQEYRQVQLVEPLARQLALKKQRMEAVLKAYAQAADAGPLEVVTEATYKTAQVYQDFGRALLAAPRPRGLKKAEAEQYTVMLEEQAFPFEEKAVSLYESNARRTAKGLWDAAIRDSITALTRLKPARWSRTEKGQALQAALATPEPPGQRAEDAERWNALGIAHRQAGRFDAARSAYERAAALRQGYADPVLNLAILDDLYLHEPARALAGYERYQSLLAAPDAQVNRWMAELKTRKPEPAVAAAGGRP